jgi:phosphate/sulfate permease
VALGVAVVVGAVAGLVTAVLVRYMRDDVPMTPVRPYHEHSASRSLRKARKHLLRVQQTADNQTRDQVDSLLAQIDSLTEAAPAVTLDSGQSQHAAVEHLFVYLQILSACFVAFAHGANDVANAIGPMAAVLDTAKSGVVHLDAPVPMWVLLVGGGGIVVGLATWGWRVIETIGRRISELTPTRGFSAEFGAAVTIVVASRMGLPISTTHTLVGAVLGVGLARGIGAINLNTVRDIVVSWVVTLPAGAALSIFFFYVLKLFF